MILEVRDLNKVYGSLRGVRTVALQRVNFSVAEGEFTAVMGESGSGKTTLLNLIATLDQPTEGDVIISGRSTRQLKANQKAEFRRNELGFVFQDFNLLDTFNNQDNIYLPLVLSGLPKAEMDRRLGPIARLLGIEQILKKYPYEISGGQKQRVAIARAVITEPSLILADEPTGALDSQSSDIILRLFNDLNANGQTIIMVTHSLQAAAHASRVLFIKDGNLVHELYRGGIDLHGFARKIMKVQSMLAGNGGLE